MLKTAEPRKDRVGVGDGSRAGRSESEINGNGIDDVEIHSGEIKVDEVEKKGRKMSKSKNLSKSKKTVGSDFFTIGAKLAFIKLGQAFLKALILHHFDPECHIRIETDLSGYTIGGVFGQLTLDDSGQWHPVTFFFCKMIPAETRYKTYDSELLAIIEAFKT